MKKRKALLSVVLAIVMAISTFTGFVPGTCLKVQAEGTTYSPASEYNDYGTLNSNDTTVQIEGVKIGDTIVDWYVIGYSSTDQTVTLLSKQSFASKQFNSNSESGNAYESSEIKGYVEGLKGEDQPLAGIKDALADISGKVTGDPETISGAVPYLLSYTEANTLSATKKSGAASSWWLRSPGFGDWDAACVIVGDADEDGDIVCRKLAVRPALKLNLSSVIFSSETNAFYVISNTNGQKDAAVVKKAPTARSLTYNGQAQELVNEGEAEGGTMQYALGTDAATAPDASAYTTSVPTGTDAGTYYVWYKAVGDENHKDTEAAEPVEVTISKKSIADAVITGLKDVTYNGKARTQKVKVTVDDAVLIEGTDYKVSYKNNTNAGVAVFTVTGINGYKDSKEASFTIKPASIKGAKVTPKKTSMVWTGKALKPGVKSVVLADGTVLKASDYTVSYKNNINTGTATIIVKGKGNYTGTATTTFKITKAEQSVKSVSPTKKTIAAGKSFTLKARASKEQGTAQFKQVSQKAKFTVASNGKVTVKKGTKAGKYTVKYKVRIKQTKNCKTTKYVTKSIVITVK